MPGFTLRTDGEPNKSKTRWFAKSDIPGDREFLIGMSVPFKDADGAHRGLYQTPVLNDIPAVFYDRGLAEAKLGLWAHFIWPSVTAEGGGHHLVVNTYDRAAFTFGFYQLAAHTPNDNLILLFRALLELPSAKGYFPDLALKGGKVHRIDGTKLISLETVTNVQRPTNPPKFEDQIIAFMTYLNPETLDVGLTEALNAARLMHWLVNDKAAVDVSVFVAFAIMKRKLVSLAAKYNLRGKDPRLALWISDIRHQARGGEAEIRAALSQPTLDSKLASLATIGSPKYKTRIATVKAKVAALMAEGRFNGVTLGDAKLPL
jgi:hypothetical protein